MVARAGDLRKPGIAAVVRHFDHRQSATRIAIKSPLFFKSETLPKRPKPPRHRCRACIDRTWRGGEENDANDHLRHWRCTAPSGTQLRLGCVYKAEVRRRGSNGNALFTAFVGCSSRTSFGCLLRDP